MLANVFVVNNLLSSEECDFIISYLERIKINEIGFEEGGLYHIRIQQIPFYHWRVQFIWRKYLKKVQEVLPNVKLNYTQMVKWNGGTSMDVHKDEDIDPKMSFSNGVVDWSSICYLNDNFRGGETRIGGYPIEIKKGRSLILHSKNLFHSVDTVYGNRYTIAAWWTEVKK